MRTEARNKQTYGRGNDAGFPRLLSGQLCLDFVNTLEARLSSTPKEFLTDYAAVAGWGYHVGLLTAAEREALMTSAAANPNEAEDVFEGALELRGSLYRIFTASAHGTKPETTDLQNLKAVYLAALEHADLTSLGDVYGWAERGTRRLERPLWSVGRSAVELLSSPEVGRVKQCPGCDDCGWLFVDTSKNGSRSWCSMEGCGSRAKMRRQYARRRRAAPLNESPPA